MITVLAVGHGAAGLARFGASHPSVEVVTAGGTEDALDRLARNRRIDAVLILDEESAPEIARLIREEDPSAPPVFAAGAGAGVESIARAAPDRMLLDVIRRLSAGE